MAFLLNSQAQGASGKNVQSTQTPSRGAQCSCIGLRPALHMDAHIIHDLRVVHCFKCATLIQHWYCELFRHCCMCFLIRPINSMDMIAETQVTKCQPRTSHGVLLVLDISKVNTCETCKDEIIDQCDAAKARKLEVGCYKQSITSQYFLYFLLTVQDMISKEKLYDFEVSCLSINFA